MKYFHPIDKLSQSPKILLSDYMKDEPEFLQRLSDIIAPVGITLNDVFLTYQDEVNAYASMGANYKRIDVYMPILNTMSHDVVLAVITHEVGHINHKHSIFITQVRVLYWLGCLLLFVCLYYAAKAKFGAKLAFITGMTFMCIVSFTVPYIVGYMHHIAEFEADKYAVNIQQDNGFYMQAFLLLITAQGQQCMLDYGGWYKYLYLHPSPMDRIDAMNELMGTSRKEFVTKLLEVGNNIWCKKTQASLNG